MSVISACTLLVHAAADAHHRLRQAARVHLLLHEGAAAHLDVQHQRVHALGQLLRHDGRRDQRNRFHRGGDVAQRVELAVGRREPVGLADEAQARARRAAPGTLRRSDRCGSREWIPACRACRRCGPSARPDIIGTTTPAAAASGATIRLVLSPTPPVECLSTLTPGIAGQIHGVAGAQHALGQAADFAVGHAGEEDGHQEGRHLIIGNFAAGVSVHQELNLFGSEFFAVALALDQVNCTHYETLSLPSQGVESKGGTLPYRGKASLLGCDDTRFRATSP